jgi:hypothetical protein
MNMRKAILVALFALTLPASVLAATYQDWVRKWESGSFEGNYSQTTTLGTATGAYQLPFAALTDLGYVKQGQKLPAFGAGEWEGIEWTGKDGVTSRASFLASKTAQDNAFASFTQKNWSYIQKFAPVGTTVNGVTMTKDGALAAAHMMGMGGFQKWSACGFKKECLIAEHAAANKMTLEEYQAHLMKRVAEGGGMDPGDIVISDEGGEGGGSGEASEVPSAFLMPIAPAGGPAAPLLPGSLPSLGNNGSHGGH